MPLRISDLSPRGYNFPAIDSQASVIFCIFLVRPDLGCHYPTDEGADPTGWCQLYEQTFAAKLRIPLGFGDLHDFA
jgi:hypothetical protein